MYQFRATVSHRLKIACTSLTLFTMFLLGTSTPLWSLTNTWMGTISSNWNTAGNWSHGVPSSADEVHIPAGTPNAPVISSHTANGSYIQVNFGASLTNNGTLTVNGLPSNNWGIQNQGTLTNNGIIHMGST